MNSYNRRWSWSTNPCSICRLGNKFHQGFLGYSKTISSLIPSKLRNCRPNKNYSHRLRQCWCRSLFIVLFWFQCLLQHRNRCPTVWYLCPMLTLLYGFPSFRSNFIFISFTPDAIPSFSFSMKTQIGTTSLMFTSRYFWFEQKFRQLIFFRFIRSSIFVCIPNIIDVLELSIYDYICSNEATLSLLPSFL